MRVVAVSMVKNESDIIESFIRCHALLVDAHYVLDNDSGDATFAILDRLREEGLPVVPIRDVDGAYDQSRKTTALMRRALAETAADVIVPLDADEIVLERDRGRFAALLGSVGPDRVGLMPCVNYLPMPQDDAREPDPLRRIVHRIERDDPRGKVFVPAAIAGRNGAWIWAGQHRVEDPAGAIAHVMVEGLRFAHFPIRSGPQLVSKVVIGRLALRASRDWKPSLGHHWNAIAAAIANPSAVTTEELTQAAITLAGGLDDGAPIVRSPLSLPYDRLRYGDLVSVDPLRRLLAFTAELLDDETRPEIAAGPAASRVEALSLVPGDWRKRWAAAEKDRDSIKREMDALWHSRGRLARALLRAMWRKGLRGRRPKDDPPTP